MKHLLPEVPKYFKANLHTHSTISDGAMTPEELKEAYKAKGYHILAITDHEIIVPHPELNDTDFLALTAYELSIGESHPTPKGKCYHLNLLAKDPANTFQFFDPALEKEVSLSYRDRILRENLQDRDYSVEYANKVIAAANEKGFLITYNHPTWSQQDYTDYIGLKGLWGMEIYNHVCTCFGYAETNDRVYQDLLNQGNRLFPIAADDFHKLRHPSHIAGGWIMVGAERLEYAAVMKALERGDFYASTGPEIHSLQLDGTVLNLRCSEAVSISIRTHRRQAVQILPDCGATLQEASFDIAPWLKKWTEEERENAFIRLTITDKSGHQAYTRAYWYDEL